MKTAAFTAAFIKSGGVYLGFDTGKRYCVPRSGAQLSRFVALSAPCAAKRLRLKLHASNESNFSFRVPCHMAGDVDHARQARDMRAERLDRAGERGHRAAEALRSDARGVDLVEDRLLHLRVQRVRVVLAHRAQQRTLGKERRLVARAAEPHADHDRRGWSPR